MTVKQRRITLISIAVIAALALALFFLPSVFLRNFVKDTLAEQGLQVRGLEDVDLNLYALSLETGPLSVVDASGDGVRVEQIGLYLRFMPLAKQRLYVSGIEISGLDLTVTTDENGAIQVAGMPPLTAPDGDTEAEEAQETGWGYGLNILAITDSTVTVGLPTVATTATIDRLTLANIKSWTPDNPARVTFDGSLGGGRVEIEGKVAPLTRDMTMDLTLVMTSLPLDMIRGGPALTGQVSGDLNIEMTVPAANPPAGQFSGTIRLAETGLTQDGIPDTSFEDLSIDDLKGSFRLSEDGTPVFAAAGGLSLDGLRVGSEARPLATIERLVLPAWALDEARTVTVQELTAEEIRAGVADEQAGDDRDLVRIGHLRLEGVETKTDPLATTIAVLEITDLAGHVTRTADGIALPEEFSTSSSTEPTPSEAPSAESAEARGLPAITIGEIRILGDSRLSYAERALHLPANFDIAFTTFEVRNINSTNPDNEASFKIAAKVNEFSDLKLDGTARPFAADGAAFDLTSRIEGMDLPRLSPYAATFLGVNLESGQLNADIDARADKGTLDSHVALKLRSLELAPLEDFDKTSLAEQIDMPIGTALDLVRDGKGEINLKIPVTGPLGDPNFDMSNAISKAVASALTGAVTTTLKIMFPVAGLASLLFDAGTDASLNLEPVLFPPGETAPLADQLKLMDGLGELMTKRPGVRVQLCGRATAADLAHRRVLTPIPDAAPTTSDPDADAPQTETAPEITGEERAALIELAAERARVVKRFVMSSHGIDATRLLECRPVFGEEDSKQPRVEIRI
jgi:hypothetical protein